MIGVLEKFGLGLSVVCMFHCIATPIVMVAFGGILQSHESHILFDIFILTTASIVMLLSVINSESRNSSLAIIGLGFLLFCFSFFVPNPFNHIFFVLGSSIWFFVHFRNLRSGSGNHLA